MAGPAHSSSILQLQKGHKGDDHPVEMPTSPLCLSGDIEARLLMWPHRIREGVPQTIEIDYLVELTHGDREKINYHFKSFEGNVTLKLGTGLKSHLLELQTFAKATDSGGQGKADNRVSPQCLPSSL